MAYKNLIKGFGSLSDTSSAAKSKGLITGYGSLAARGVNATKKTARIADNVVEAIGKTLNKSNTGAKDIDKVKEAFDYLSRRASDALYSKVAKQADNASDTVLVKHNHTDNIKNHLPADSGSQSMFTNQRELDVHAKFGQLGNMPRSIITYYPGIRI